MEPGDTVTDNGLICLTVIAGKYVPLNTINVIGSGPRRSQTQPSCRLVQKKREVDIKCSMEKIARGLVWTCQVRPGCTQGANQMLCKGKNRLVKYKEWKSGKSESIKNATKGFEHKCCSEAARWLRGKRWDSVEKPLGKHVFPAF